MLFCLWQNNTNIAKLSIPLKSPSECENNNNNNNSFEDSFFFPLSRKEVLHVRTGTLWFILICYTLYIIMFRELGPNSVLKGVKNGPNEFNFSLLFVLFKWAAYPLLCISKLFWSVNIIIIDIVIEIQFTEFIIFLWDLDFQKQ